MLVMASAAPAGADVVSDATELRGAQSEMPIVTSAIGALAECDGKAGLYASERGVKFWVVRQGAMTEQNPLRPLSRDVVLVLEIVANGRLVTAYGPDAANLHQGGPVPELERLNAPVAWSAAADRLPDQIRIVGPDGSVLLGPMRFESCGDPPKTALPRTAPPRAATPARAGDDAKPVRPARAPVALPQGAIP